MLIFFRGVYYPVKLFNIGLGELTLVVGETDGLISPVMTQTFAPAPS